MDSTSVPHDLTLITTLAAALGLALVLGFLATRLRLPALVGYLLAGVLIGPATPGFVADVDLSRQLAEIGVILLMFGVGLHFSLQDLLSVRRIAVPGALARAELNREAVEHLRERGILAISGDASDPAVMVQTHIARARLLVIAAPDALRGRRMLEIARQLNPLIEAAQGFTSKR